MGKPLESLVFKVIKEIYINEEAPLFKIIILEGVVLCDMGRGWGVEAALLHITKNNFYAWVILEFHISSRLQWVDRKSVV